MAVIDCKAQAHLHSVAAAGTAGTAVADPTLAAGHSRPGFAERRLGTVAADCSTETTPQSSKMRHAALLTLCSGPGTKQCVYIMQEGGRKKRV